jgi:hypothetical protein
MAGCLNYHEIVPKHTINRALLARSRSQAARRSGGAGGRAGRAGPAEEAGHLDIHTDTS